MKAGDLEVVHNYSTGDLYISFSNITSLKGCPEKIHGYFSCFNNNLTSFEHFPKYIMQNCSISCNQFTSFKDIDKHIEYIGGDLNAFSMNFSSGFLDLFGIDGLNAILIDDFPIARIVNRYLKEKDIINFQDEMIKFGFESYL